MKRFVMMLLVLCSAYADNESVQNLHRFIMATYYEFGQDLQTSGMWYNQITPQEDSVYVYHGYIPYLQAVQNFQQIVTLIPQLDRVFEKNQTIQTIFAQALEQVGQKTEAQKRLIALNDKNKTNQELAFKVVQIYLENKELENALLVIDNLLNSSPRKSTNYVFLFIKSQIYLQLNKKSEALAAIQACIEAYPRFDKSWLLYAILQEQEGKIDQAIKGYTNFLENTDQANAEIQRHLLQLNLRQKLLQKTAPQQNPKDLHARIMTLEELGAHKKYEEAAQQLITWALDTPEHVQLWLKCTHILSQQAQDPILGVKVITKIENKLGYTLYSSLYRADLALRAGLQKQALDALQKAYLLTSDVPLQQKIVFQELMIHYEARDWGSFKQALAKVTLEATTYAPLLNLAAYYHATKGKNIGLAQELIQWALAHDSKNPHYLDTQALIWSKQKKYDQAIALLETIAHECDSDCLVPKHLHKIRKISLNDTKH